MSALEAVLRPVALPVHASRQRLTLWVGSPFGLPIGLHASFLIAFLILTFTLGDEILPRLLRDDDLAARTALGAAATLFLFLSVLAHELAHGLAARRLGMSVDGVVLFALGGVVSIDGGPARARDEAIVTAVGPIASICIAAGSSAGFALLRGSAPPAVTLLLLFLALTNGSLAAFNLIPSVPLDGGRLLHSLLWRLTGSAIAASRYASALGIVVAALIVMLGVRHEVAGDHLDALWYVATGLYLGWGAATEMLQARADSAALSGGSVDLATAAGATLCPAEQLATDYGSESVS